MDIDKPVTVTPPTLTLVQVLLQARQNKDELLDILIKPTPFFFNGNREIIVKER